ncbi:MAG: hypothetical protein ACWA5U_05280 [bacterium]
MAGVMSHFATLLQMSHSIIVYRFYNGLASICSMTIAYFLGFSYACAVKSEGCLIFTSSRYIIDQYILIADEFGGLFYQAP